MSQMNLKFLRSQMNLMNLKYLKFDLILMLQHYLLNHLYHLNLMYH